jgi:hypothetical protein
MALGRKTGGRKKGTPNKMKGAAPENLTFAARDTLVKMGIDPIESMARIAKQAEADGDRPLAMSGYKEVAKYWAPQLKAVEVTGAGGQALTLQVVTGVPK